VLNDDDDDDDDDVGRTNVRRSLVDLFRSSQVAKYAINFGKHLLSLDSICKV
jgi:hypothetical protein